MDRQEIAEKITRDELLSITQSLIRSPSLNPPGDNRECADLVAEVLQREGITVEKVAASDRLVNVVATLEGSGTGKTLMYNGHLDVVPAGSDWTQDPWGGVLVDGKVYGRGSSDMKGGIGAMMGSMIALRRSANPFNGKIVLTAVADEETGSDHGTVFLLKNGLVRADYALVAEPTKGWIEIGNRGLLWMEITVKGKSSHASRPGGGVNAIHNAAKAIGALTSLRFAARQEIFEIPEGSLSVTMIEGGTKINSIPDRCILGLDRRLLPGEDAQEEQERILKAVAAALDGDADFEAKRLKYWPPVLSDANSDLVRILANAVEEVTQTKLGIRAKAGSTDCSFIHSYLGIPIVLYGPGASRLAHAADEYVEMDDVVQACKVYTLTALDLLV